MNVQPTNKTDLPNRPSGSSNQDSQNGDSQPSLSDFFGTGADKLGSHFKLPSGLDDLAKMQSPEASSKLAELSDLLDKLSASSETVAAPDSQTESDAADGASAMENQATDAASEGQAAGEASPGGDIAGLLEQVKALLEEIVALLQGGSAGGAGEHVGPRTIDGSDEAGSGSPAPEGAQHAESLDGAAKFYGANEADAQKLKSTFDEMYQNDQNFKNEVDSVIAEKGSINITAKGLDPNILGLAMVGGNTLAIDTDHVRKGGDDLKETLAHEVLHNVGHNHGADMDAAIHKATDTA